MFFFLIKGLMQYPYLSLGLDTQPENQILKGLLSLYYWDVSTKNARTLTIDNIR